MLALRDPNPGSGGEVNGIADGDRLTDEQRLDWLRLIRSQNVGPRGMERHGGGLVSLV
jgi:hypothetical protein